MPDPLSKSFYRRFHEARAGWLRRLAPLFVVSLLVLALGGGSTFLLVRFTDWLLNYRTPLAKFPPPGEPTEPLASQLVLVIIDGLRDDSARQMPTLQRLRAQGASAIAVVPFPMSQPAWTTLVTGAEAEINDAALTNTDLAHTRPIAPESLFATAERANLNVAIAAHDSWQPMVAPQFLDEAYFVSDSENPDTAVGDRRVAEAAVSFLNNFAPNFMLVYFALPDHVGHRFGATGEAYRQAALHTDQLLAQVVGAMNLRQSVLVVTADHGHIDQGGHGGAEDAVKSVPLVVVGARIRPADHGLVRQSDIAPTIAALIGSSIPSSSQGSILFSMLEMSDTQRANKALALAKQQREFGAAYLAAIGGTLSEAALNDPFVAKSSFEVKNYESTFSLANLAARAVQHDIGAARRTRIDRERLARLPVAILLIAIPLVILWFRRSLRLTACALIALGVVAMQHALYLYSGHLYSFSDVRSIEQFGRALIERSTTALLFGGVLVIIYHWHDRKPSRVPVAQTFLIACVLGAYLSSVPFTLGYYVNGLSSQWYIGDVGWGFVQVFSLTFITSLCLLAVPMAALVALAYWLALIIVHRLAQIRVIADCRLQIADFRSRRLRRSDAMGPGDLEIAEAKGNLKCSREI